MTYGIILWGKAHINVNFVLQKRSIRVISKLGSGVSLRDKFKDIKIFALASENIYKNVILMKNTTFFIKNLIDVINIQS